MHSSKIMNEEIMEATDYPAAEREIKEDGWVISTYPSEGSSRLGGYKLCDLCVEVTSPDGKTWAENRGPIYTETGSREAESAIQTARWIKDHWAEVVNS